MNRLVEIWTKLVDKWIDRWDMIKSYSLSYEFRNDLDSLFTLTITS